MTMELAANTDTRKKLRFKKVNGIDKKTILIAVLVFLLIWAGWALFRSSVPYNGNGIDEIRNDIHGIEEQQRDTDRRLESVENGLNDSAGRLGEISAGIGQTERSIDRIKSGIEQSEEHITNDAGRIAEGQRILERIRKGGKEN